MRKKQLEKAAIFKEHLNILIQSFLKSLIHIGLNYRYNIYVFRSLLSQSIKPEHHSQIKIYFIRRRNRWNGRNIVGIRREDASEVPNNKSKQTNNQIQDHKSESLIRRKKAINTQKSYVERIARDVNKKMETKNGL